MRNGEWTLAYGSESVDFGLTDSEAVFTAAPDLGDAAIAAADVARPRADGVAFGVDFRGGRTISVEVGIVRPSEAETLAAVERLARLWRADEVRSTPGATATLIARHGDRERLVYGRPRRFAQNIDHVREGLAAVVCDFTAADDCFYSVSESSGTVVLVPPPSGGLIAPLSSPLATTESSDRSMGITVGGSLPAWPVIEIEGPITNPVIDVVGLWRMEFRLTLAEGSTLVVDTRPWARTIKRDGASVPGVISRTSTRLSKASLPPGSYEVALRGTSQTGSASARLSWRDTFPTL